MMAHLKLCIVAGWVSVVGVACGGAAQSECAAAGRPLSTRAAPSADVVPVAAEMREDEAAISAMLDDWHHAAGEADGPRYFAHFAQDGIFMGTDATERWDVPAFQAYARPHFLKGKGWKFRSTRRSIMFAPGRKLAWFDEDLATEKMGPARGTGVVVWSDSGGWKIAHYNLALTIPNERFDEVKALLDGPPPSAPSDDDPPRSQDTP